MLLIDYMLYMWLKLLAFHKRFYNKTELWLKSSSYFIKVYLKNTKFF